MTAPESPAEELNRAVAKMRADADRCGDAPGSFIPAVADLLERTARRAAGIDGYEDSAVYPLMVDSCRLPLAVARAFLGETEGPARD